jgi:hypothetical protein
MTIKITYANGKTEIIPNAINVDYNYHEGTYDFFDENGQPMKQLVTATSVTGAHVTDKEIILKFKRKEPISNETGSFLFINPATTYFPTQVTVQYHRLKQS